MPKREKGSSKNTKPMIDELSLKNLGNDKDSMKKKSSSTKNSTNKKSTKSCRYLRGYENLFKDHC